MTACARPIIAAWLLATLACKRGESRVPLSIGGDATFDGARVELIAARGEVLGVRVDHSGGGTVSLAFAKDGVRVETFAVERYVVKRPSTELYGGSRGAGEVPDGLVATTAPATDPAWLEIAIARDAAPGERRGELVVDDKRVPVVLTIARATLPPLRQSVWAYEDPREFSWAQLGESSVDAPGDVERACIAMFRAHGVLLSPDLPATAYATRKELLAGAAFVPALLPDDPTQVGDAARAWLAATAGTGQTPFAIPIDEPYDAAARAKVRALADATHAAARGFVYAVTDSPHAEYGSAVDLYISPRAAHLTGDRYTRWTYNGAPPRAGAMVLDAAPPGPRTWGVIAWRWQIYFWYVWDALYWHDRHNAKRRHEPLPGPALDPRADSISFDDGSDRGNLDGVLALPGDARAPCKPTLRLAAIRRGNFDRALLDAAARCDAAAAERIAAALVPTALADAPARGAPSWPSDGAAWETARRELIAIASRCAE
jgi:hypothetical protein